MTQERDPAVKIENIDIQATIEKAQILVREDVIVKIGSV